MCLFYKRSVDNGYISFSLIIVMDVPCADGVSSTETIDQGCIETY